MPAAVPMAAHVATPAPAIAPECPCCKREQVIVLEARSRPGGRVWTANTITGPVELGAG